METISGDIWLREWAKWIRMNEAKLSDAGPTQTQPPGSGLGSWLGLGAFIGASSSPGQGDAHARRRAMSTAAPSTASRGSSSSSGSAQPLALRINLHYLYYLLLRADAISLPVGPLDVRIPSASLGATGAPPRPTSYLSILTAAREEKRRGRGEQDQADAKSAHSVRSGFSLAPSTWWGLGSVGSSASGANGNGVAGQLADPDRDLKYVYSALTKIPSLKLGPPPLLLHGKIIKGYEDNCPGIYSVPLDIFKNVQVLETADVDPRTFIGWDRLSVQLRSLTCTRSGLEDVTDLFVDKVVDDAQRRKGERVKERRRKVHAPEGAELEPVSDTGDEEAEPQPAAAQPNGTSGDAHNGEEAEDPSLLPSQAAAKAAAKAPSPIDALPSLAWHFLRYLSLADNALTFLPSAPFMALTGLTHLDLSSNLLNSVPPALAALPSLAVLNLNTNLLDSVRGIYTLTPHIRVLNLSHNRLDSLCGLERLSVLRRIDLRHNELYDVGEIGRLVDCEKIAEVWVGTGNIGLWEERPDWRVECFVLFEQEGRFGVKIDGEGPGWLERGRIRERVPQTAKWKQAKAAADAAASSEAEALQAKLVGNKSPSDKARAKGKAKLVVTSGSETDEAEAEVVGPAAYRAVMSRRNRRMSASSNATRATSGKTASLSSPRAGARKASPHLAPPSGSASLKLPLSTSTSPLGAPNSAEAISSSGAEHASNAVRRRIEALKGEVGDDWLRLMVARNEQEKALASSAPSTPAGGTGRGAAAP